MLAPPLHFCAEVGQRLSIVAPSFVGRRFLLQQDAPPRFVWTLTGEVGSGPWRPGLAPRVLHKDEWAFDVHCWGVDLEQAYRLRQALVTALRDMAAGASFLLGRTAAPLGDESWLALGEVLVVSVTVHTDLVEGALTDLGDAPVLRVRPKAAEFERPPADWPAPGRLVSKER